MTTAKKILQTGRRQIELRGVRVHNLKNIDIDIPLGQLVVITGVSGSGKSSLGFDTLFAEGQRRYIESFSITARQHLERIERPNADRISHVPPAIGIRSDRVRRSRQVGRSTAATIADLMDGLRLLFARVGQIICPTCHSQVQSQTSADVVRTIASLPAGTRCQVGFAAPHSSAQDDPIPFWLARGFSRAIWNGTTHDLSTKPALSSVDELWLIVDRFIAGKSSVERIAESTEVAFREGIGRCWLLIDQENTSGETSLSVDGRLWRQQQFDRHLVCPTCHREFLPVEPRLFSHLGAGACLTCRGTGRGSGSHSANSICSACDGTRYRNEARAVQVAGRSIANISSQTAPQVMAFVSALNDSLSQSERNSIELVRSDIQQRFRAACELGLDYLTLDRAAETLSGGESRRLMLAAVIGSRITGTLVVVDEPSAGLAPSELPQVIDALRKVQALRNSVIAVEHSPVVIAAADYVIELGPAAGTGGGEIVYQGPPDKPSPPTQIEASAARKLPSRSSSQWIRLTNIQQRNLESLDVQFLTGKLNVVSGPSGSGKTTLLTQLLFPKFCQHLGCALDSESKFIGTCDLIGGDDIVDVVLIDQTPLTKSSRSNPATWLEIFDEIRQTFAATLDARQRGFAARHFSFNSSASGRCRSCQGTGLLKHDMQFLPDVTLVCPECGGTRYRREILDVKYRGRSIADVLAMSVSDAATFFRSQTRVQHRLQLVEQIGLGYLVLGQPSETLSGGEAQRLKLAARLAMPHRGPCLMICDEPTTGLHPSDVINLLICLRELITKGHTLVMADNSPELLAAADFTVDLIRLT